MWGASSSPAKHPRSPNDLDFVKDHWCKESIRGWGFHGLLVAFNALTIPKDGKVVILVMVEKLVTYLLGRQKAGLEHKIDFIESQALPALDKLLENPKNEGSFDYAFVDAEKINYINYHERIMKLVKVNGIVVYDNTLWFGMVLKEFKEGRASTIEFNKSLAADPRIASLHVPLGDGFRIHNVSTRTRGTASMISIMHKC
ncbi:probable caffeoyl-CoA O-methyltransferase [Tanacetum coccineum]